MRRCGYGEHHGKETSYISRIGNDEYPHYHVYVGEKNGGLEINLHLDQKQGSLGDKMHAGEYSGPLVEQEMARILRWAQYVKQMPAPSSHQEREIM